VEPAKVSVLFSFRVNQNDQLPEKKKHNWASWPCNEEERRNRSLKGCREVH
jgi:hypothetical protein